MEYVKQVFEPVECYVAIKLDLRAIEALQLEISTER